MRSAFFWFTMFRSSETINFLYFKSFGRRQTFENLKYWNEEINNNSDPSIIKILIGNQVDGPDRYVNIGIIIESFIDKWNMMKALNS